MTCLELTRYVVRVVTARPAQPSDVEALRELAAGAYKRYTPRIGRPPTPIGVVRAASETEPVGRRRCCGTSFPGVGAGS